jgi:hypothetical protein
MRKILFLSCLLIAPAAQAWDCKYEKVIDETLDLSGSESLRIAAAAGDLEVRGGSGSEARIRGTVCASKAEWLEKATIETGGGRNAEIAVDLPETSGWSITGSSYAYIDLEVEVPRGIAVHVDDSSGDADISGLASLSVSDSSGDVEISDIKGDVSVKDSSGDIEVERVGGDLLIVNDSSGDVEVSGVDGSVRVEVDSSGDLEFTDVGKDVWVERDSSGDIDARDVGGSFTVDRDGSGEIRYSRVTGKVSIPDDKS